MIKQALRIILFAILTFLSFHATPNEVYARSGLQPSGVYPVAGFEILEDTNGIYDFDRISSVAYANQFQQYTEPVLSLGITRSVYWVRFRLPHNGNNSTETSQLLQINNPNLDKMELFIPVADNSSRSGIRYSVKAVGVSRPSSNMDIMDNTWVFSIPGNFSPDQFVYLRLESTSALRLPILLWQDNNAFISHVFLKNLGFGFFYGILLAMFLYNFFIFIILRDKAYGFYIVYIGFMLLYQSQVHGHLKLWLHISSYQIYNLIFWLDLAAVFISSVYFTRSFLQIGDEASSWDKVMKSLVLLAILQGVFGGLGYNYWANQLAHGLGLGGPIVFMCLAVVRIRQGFTPARYYLLAWGVLSAGIVVWVLAAYIPDTFSAVNYLLVATASESILLSFSLSYRVKTMKLKKEAMKKHIQYYRDLSLTDELTGLYNKRCLTKKLKQEVDLAQLYKRHLTVLLIDIDHFKSYNDRYGHWEGDQVLTKVGEVLFSNLENSQFAFRFGGEEFVILLPDVNCEEAVPFAETLRKEIRAVEFLPVSAEAAITLSVSIGLTELRADDTVETFFQRADDAMYEAKAAGRNRVICSMPETTPLALPHIIWKLEWGSGHFEIDKQHRDLLQKSDKLFVMSLLTPTEPEKVMPVLENLLEVINNHFNSEEQILADFDYPDAKEHKLKHEQLLAKAAALKDEYQEGKIKTSTFISFIVDDIVLEHMQNEDKLFFPYLQKKNTKPEEEDYS